MQDIVKTLAWPVCIAILVIIFLIMFRSQIATALSRVSRADIDLSGKKFGLTFEQSVQSQVNQLDDLQRDIKTIVDTAAISQDRAITVAWGLIERKLRRILAISHWNEGIYVDVKTSIKSLIDLGVLAKNTLPNLSSVEDERSRILSHRQQGNKLNTEIATITAIQILRSLYAISLQENIVEIPNIKLYSDEKCQNEIPNVTGIMIKQIMVNGLEPTVNVFPTTRTDYTVGERLTWDWNISRIWNALWYKDPKTGEIKRLSAAEFVGADLDDL